MDRLSPFFRHFTLSARVFFSGRQCGVSCDQVRETAGHLHVVRSGALKILQPAGPPVTIQEPTVLFYPRPCEHTFEYLAAWRVGVAQSLLKKGEPLMMVAPRVGYSSAAALTRVFREPAGMSPTEWVSKMTD
jgi:AraC-like DNA-binding protein